MSVYDEVHVPRKVYRVRVGPCWYVGGGGSMTCSSLVRVNEVYQRRYSLYVLGSYRAPSYM